MTYEEKTICEEKTNSVTDKVVYANEEWYGNKYKRYYFQIKKIFL
jgi:hypothetical protein